jgi:hypothetical protein
MSALYRILLAWAEFDLAIAKSTGRSPANIEQLQRDVDKWEHALLMTRINA